jgi:multiple sugar transport system permease protein
MNHTSRFQQTLYFMIVLLVAVAMMYPLIWMISSSFKPNVIIFRELGLWPSEFTLENYINGWRGFGRTTFTTFYVNSIIIVTLAIVGNLITCSMAAYAFARLNFSFKSVLFAAMLVTIMLPYHVVLIPQYMLYFNLGWVNTFLPLTVHKFLATDAFFIFLMIQFIRGLPIELDHAATVDGCGPTQIYLLIIMPLLTPALITTAIFTFIWTWNDFFSQLIYLSNPLRYTVSLGLRSFLDSTGESAWGSLFAMSVVSLIPIMAFFISAQRFLITGIATTGLKG